MSGLRVLVTDSPQVSPSWKTATNLCEFFVSVVPVVVGTAVGPAMIHSELQPQVFIACRIQPLEELPTKAR